MEERYPVKFFYRESWVEDIRLGYYPGRQFLEEILDTLFYGKAIYYYCDKSGNIVLTRYYAIRPLQEKLSAEQQYIPGLEYDSGTKGESAGGNIVFNLGNPADRDKPGQVNISGVITDLNTREPVAGVTVHIPELSSGAISNALGYYSLTIPRGTYSVKFSFIGMKERIVDVNVYGPGELNIEMRSVLIPLRETVVTATRNMTVQRFETGLEKIDLTTFRLMPTSMGESDIIKNMLLIPGVHSVGEGSAGFNVRGGSAGQNLILLYGAPVYNSSHFFGFFSSVNPDIIKEANLYKGGIPARYGGRLSSVLDIISRDGNRREFTGNAGISPVTTHITIEGPIIKDTLFYIISGRTTYSNWLLGMLEDKALRNSSASFKDLNARIAWDPGRHNKFDLSAYYSSDGFKFNSDTLYRYENKIAAFRWRHFFSGRFFSSFSAITSSYNYDVSASKIPQEAFSLTHKVSGSNIKTDFVLFSGQHELNFGVDFNTCNVQPGNYAPSGDSSLVKGYSVQKQRAISPSLFFEEKYSVTGYLSVNAGLRFTTYHAIGPQKIFTYDSDFPKSISSVTDTLYWGKARNYRTYYGPELRLSVNLKFSNTSSFKINYNHTKQYVHLLSNTTSISPTDIWKLSDYHLKPQSGDQLSAGFYQMLYKNKIETSAEVYYKFIRNMADFKGGTDIIMNEYIERDIINVEGKAYGLELMIRKQEGRVRWSAAYTYSRSLLRSTGVFDEEKINNGNWFPANYDKPHDLILTFNYLYSRRLSYSITYNYSTGRPVTYPVATYMVGDIPITHYSERNKYRVPDYSRLDLSVKISGNLKSKKIAHPHWIFSLYNAMGRQNVYSVFFRKDGNKIKGYMLSVFGRPIPSVSFNFDF